jgi:hypothetical protein
MDDEIVTLIAILAVAICCALFIFGGLDGMGRVEEVAKGERVMDGLKGKITETKLVRAARTIDADKIKTMDDVRLLFKAIDIRVQPDNSDYSELEHLCKEQE